MQDTVSRAKDFLKSGNYPEAKQCLQNYCAENEKNAEAWYLLATAYGMLGDYLSAEACLRKILAFNNGIKEVHALLGKTCLQLNKFSGARDALQNAVSLGDSSPGVEAELGLACYHTQEYLKAIDHLNNASKRLPNAPEPHFYLASSYQMLGQATEALKAFQVALDLKPDYLEALYRIAALLQRENRNTEALEYLLRAAEFKPDNANLQYNIGVLLQEQGETLRAASHYIKALELNDSFAEACNNLALIETSFGNEMRAEELFERAIRIRPDYIEALNNLGTLHQGNGDFAKATHCYQRAVEVQPDYIQARLNLGKALYESGEQSRAIECFEQTLSLSPGNPEIQWARTMCRIPLFYSHTTEITESRNQFSKELAGLEEIDEDSLQKANIIVGSQQPFYLAYQPENNRNLLSRYGALCSRSMRRWQPELDTTFSTYINDKRKLDIGIVSAHIRDHSVWNAIIKGWIRHLDRNTFNIHIFHTQAKRDRETEWAESYATTFTRGPMTIEQWINAIRNSGPDILVFPEIGIDATCLQLASLRLARIQMASWGHPETTGLQTMDYYLSAELLEPADADAAYTEKLVKLPNLGCCYQALETGQSDIDLAALGLDNQENLVLCPGTPFKYLPGSDHVLTDIARTVGHCKFVFFRYRLREISDMLEQRLKTAFSTAGLEPVHYLSFIPWQSRAEYFALMNRAKIMLDTIGFSGFNTAMQAMESGLPLVAYEGPFMRGRLASGILRRIGLHDLVCNSTMHFAQKAARLLTDETCLNTARATITKNRHLLFNDTDTISAFESILREALERRRIVE